LYPAPLTYSAKVDVGLACAGFHLDAELAADVIRELETMLLLHLAHIGDKLTIGKFQRVAEAYTRVDTKLRLINDGEDVLPTGLSLEEINHCGDGVRLESLNFEFELHVVTTYYRTCPNSIDVVHHILWFRDLFVSLHEPIHQ